MVSPCCTSSMRRKRGSHGKKFQLIYSFYKRELYSLVSSLGTEICIVYIIQNGMLIFLSEQCGVHCSTFVKSTNRGRHSPVSWFIISMASALKDTDFHPQDGVGNCCYNFRNCKEAGSILKVEG